MGSNATFVVGKLVLVLQASGGKAITIWKGAAHLGAMCEGSNNASIAEKATSGRRENMYATPTLGLNYPCGWRSEGAVWDDPADWDRPKLGLFLCHGRGHLARFYQLAVDV
jgi:hypothetical protein